MRANTDWVDLIEALYSTTEDDHAWGERIVEVAKDVFGTDERVAMSAVRHDPECSEFDAELTANLPYDYDVPGTAEAFRRLGREFFSTLWYPPTPVTTHGEIAPRLNDAGRAALARFQKAFSSRDALGLCLQPEPGLALVLSAPTNKTVVLEAHERRLLTRIALHLETAFRLRRRPEVVTAVLSADGQIVHRESGAAPSAAMKAQVKRIERAKTRATRRTAESVELWNALVAGHASVVEREEGRRRHYLFVENAPSTHRLRALSAREVEALSFAARGVSAKLIAYALGVSAPTISSRLASAAAKIGLATRTELVRIAAMLTRDPRVALDDVDISAAEREVLELLVRGLSNREIAVTRERSLRTIANQVAELLRKTGSPTRRALVARLG